MRTSSSSTQAKVSCPWPTLVPAPMAPSSSSAQQKLNGMFVLILYFSLLLPTQSLPQQSYVIAELVGRQRNVWAETKLQWAELRFILLPLD